MQIIGGKRTVKRGRFITLEGTEGAGKSTAAQYLADRLSARGLKVVMTREPGGTPLAEKLRTLVLDHGTETIGPVTETLMMFAARGVHLDNLIRPALERGDWVICDRFTDATRAYQGAGRGVDPALIESLARAVQSGLEPDRTLLFDLPVEVGLGRARTRRQAPDRFEVERQEFFDRIRAAYLEIAARSPERVRVIDAAMPLASVQAQLDQVVEELL